MRAALDDMRANGVEIVDVTLPGGADVGQIFYEFHAAFDEYLAAQPSAPIRSLQELVDLGVEDPQFQEMLRGELAVATPDFPGRLAALAGRPAFRDKVAALMDDLDLDAIFYPESPLPAPLIGHGASPFDCQSAGYGGLPAIAIPAGFTPDGLPLVRADGRPFAEETLIAMAAGYEAHTNHRLLPPTTPPL